MACSLSHAYISSILYFRTVCNHLPAYIVKIQNKVHSLKGWVYIICILNLFRINNCHLAFDIISLLGRILRWPRSVTAISICSRPFQFYSREFQFTYGNFNFSSNKLKVHCRLYPIRQHERLSIKLRKLQQAKSSWRNIARNVNLAQPSTSAHSAPRIDIVQNNDVR